MGFHMILFKQKYKDCKLSTNISLQPLSTYKICQKIFFLNEHLVAMETGNNAFFKNYENMEKMAIFEYLYLP